MFSVFTDPFGAKINFLAKITIFIFGPRKQGLTMWGMFLWASASAWEQTFLSVKRMIQPRGLNQFSERFQNVTLSRKFGTFFSENSSGGGSAGMLVNSPDLEFRKSGIPRVYGELQFSQS